MNDVLKVSLKVLFALLIVGGVVIYFLSSSCPPGHPFSFKTFKCSNQTPDKYDCVVGSSGPVCQTSPSGSYSSKEECQAKCSSSLTYSCSDSKCVPDQNGVPLEECQKSCSPPPSKYSCVSYSCQEDPNGAYDSLQACQDSCEAPRYSCESNCSPDPQGMFTSQADCLTSCIPSSAQININLSGVPSASYRGSEMTYVPSSGHFAQFVLNYTGTSYNNTINVDVVNKNFVVTDVYSGPGPSTTTTTRLTTPYKGDQIYTQLSDNVFLSLSLPLYCNGRGVITDNTGKCSCDQGYESTNDCLCPSGLGGPKCQYSRTVHCNNFGTPDADGNCVCDPGHAGPSCQYSDDVRCNNHGRYDPSTQSCVCDPGYDSASNCKCPPGQNGPSCQFSRQTTCNGNGDPDINGVCKCDKTLPTNCTSFDSNCACNGCVLDDSSIPSFGGYSYQKFVVNSQPGKGCVVNTNPWAWGDIVGASAHKQDADASQCLNGAVPYQYVDQGDAFNACALTPGLFNSLKGTKVTSTISNKSYDFSQVGKNTTLQAPISGPYTRLVYNPGDTPNDSYFLAPSGITVGKYNMGTDETLHISNNFVNDPYIQAIFSAQKSAIAALGNSPGTTHVRPAWTLGNNSDNPSYYSSLGAPL